MGKRIPAFIFTGLLVLSAFAADSRAKLLNSNWLFHIGNTPGAEFLEFDDSGWRQLSLPHDWSVEGQFSILNPAAPGGGALPGGIGWYRRYIQIDAGQLTGHRVMLDIDGVYMNSSVYVNGHLAGTRPNGYISYSYDITPLLTSGQNIIAVKVDNSLQPNSRWYSGSGIYRNVWLRNVPTLHIAKDGLWIQTNHITPNEASITVKATLSQQALGSRLLAEVIDAQGVSVASATTECNDCDVIDIPLSIPSPRRWDCDSPTLYTLRAILNTPGIEPDTLLQTFGLREFSFSAESGFSLNGRPLKLNGVCLHHDYGALGTVTNTAAIERQLRIMKEMGVNAIRCTHNPPAPELLDICDRMGLLVMDEAFDMWRRKKTAYDYSMHFDLWHERDLADLIVRDRNHPSIVMWSIGNEVLEQWSDASADALTIEQTNLLLNMGHGPNNDGNSMSPNAMLTSQLATIVRNLDNTRPITAGCNEPDPTNHLFASNALDIIGFNYHDAWFPTIPNQFPGMPFIVTESVSALMTRGHYCLPADSIIICPERWDKPYYHPSFACSAFDNCHVPWGSTHETILKLVRDNPFIAGQFVWTGFDYLGEPTPYGWPARSSYFGLVDLAGFPKDAYYLYQSQWQSDRTVLHLLPHWNWEPDQIVDVWAYFNNADEVELYINGVSAGVKHHDSETLHAAWQVKFQPGTIEAISRLNGHEVARDKRVTASLPHSIRLTPESHEIKADGTDLCYIHAEIVDINGNLCPMASDLITFEISGAAFNAGVDNGNPTSHEPFKANRRRAFNGKALVIAQSNGTAGTFTVKASAPGLEGDSLIVPAH